jgi:hypothetical protein
VELSSRWMLVPVKLESVRLNSGRAPLATERRPRRGWYPRVDPAMARRNLSGRCLAA